MITQHENLSENGRKLYEIFKKEFLDNGELYNGCIPMNSTIATNPCFSAIEELVQADIIQLRNSDGFAYELTETEQKIILEEKGKTKSNEIYLRLFSAAICDLFEDLLEQHDITIPSNDREGEDGEARIYGDVYFDLEAKVTKVLAELCDEVKAAPEIEINIEDYNGFKEPNVEEVLEDTSKGFYEKHILSHLTEKGLDVSQIELEIIDFIDNDHKDCSWYGGTVAEVKYKDYLFSLEARGDIICTLFDKNEKELGYVKDRNNGSSFRYEMAHCLANDAELYRAKEDGRLVFENNNWFEIFVRTPDKEWQQATWLTETDDIEDCVFEMIETMDEMIEELGLSKQSKETTIANTIFEDGKKYVFGNFEFPTNNKKDFSNQKNFCGDIVCRIYLKEAPNKEFEKFAKEKDGENYSSKCFFIEAIAGKDKVDSSWATSNWFLFYVDNDGKNFLLDDEAELMGAWEYLQFKTNNSLDKSLKDDVADATVRSNVKNKKGKVNVELTIE